MKRIPLLATINFVLGWIAIAAMRFVADSVAPRDAIHSATLTGSPATSTRRLRTHPRAAVVQVHRPAASRAQS